MGASPPPQPLLSDRLKSMLLRTAQVYGRFLSVWLVWFLLNLSYLFYLKTDVIQKSKENSYFRHFVCFHSLTHSQHGPYCRLLNHRSEEVLSVRVIHSRRLRMSLVEVVHRDRVVVVSHLVGHEQLPTPQQVRHPQMERRRT